MDEFDIWNPVPSGSRVCALVTTDGDDFMAMVRVRPTSGAQTVFGTAALLNGPACVDLQPNTGYGVGATLNVGDEGPTVNVELTCIGPNGDTLFSRTSTNRTANSTLNVVISVVPA